MQIKQYRVHPTEDWNKVRVGRADSRGEGSSSSNGNGLSNSGGAQGSNKKKATFCVLV